MPTVAGSRMGPPQPLGQPLVCWLAPMAQLQLMSHHGIHPAPHDAATAAASTAAVTCHATPEAGQKSVTTATRHGDVLPSHTGCTTTSGPKQVHVLMNLEPWSSEARARNAGGHVAYACVHIRMLVQCPCPYISLGLRLSCCNNARAYTHPAATSSKTLTDWPPPAAGSRNQVSRCHRRGWVVHTNHAGWMVGSPAC